MPIRPFAIRHRDTALSHRVEQLLKFYLDFIKKYVLERDTNDAGYPYALTVGSMITQVPKQCGDNLSRENTLRQAASLVVVAVPMLLPGIKINTSPIRYFPINQEQMARFDGNSWVRFAEMLNG